MDAISNVPPGDHRPPTERSRRRPGSLVAGALLLALTIGFGYAALGAFLRNPNPSAVAQSGDLAGNPVVGVWQFVDDIGDPLGNSFGQFHSDGAFVDINIGVTSLGFWRPTGENTLEVFNVVASLGMPGEPMPGAQVYHTTFTYDPATDTLAGVYSPTLFDENGEVFIWGAKYSVLGTRVDFESLAASTPTP